VWQSLADANGDSDGNSHSNSNTNGYSNSYSHADSYAYCDSNSYAYADGYAYGYSNSHAYTDSYAYGYGNSYAHTDSYAYVDTNNPAETKPDTKAASDTAASPVSGSGKLIGDSSAQPGSSDPGCVLSYLRLPACLISQEARYGTGDNGVQLGALVKGGSASPWRAVAFGGGGRTR
jgi:hypothetical protein